jgi:hypothetical protein
LGRLPPTQHEKETGQQGMGDGDSGALGTTADAQTMELRSQIGVLGVQSHPGGFLPRRRQLDLGLPALMALPRTRQAQIEFIELV